MRPAMGNGDDKEDVDPDEPAGEPRKPPMKKHHGEHGDCPQTIDVLSVFHGWRTGAESRARS